MTNANEQPAAPEPNLPQPIEIASHSAAGLRLYKFPRFKQVQLKFDNVVPVPIQDQLHHSGWTYRDAEGVYTKQFGLDGPGTAIVKARRLFGELCQALSPESEMTR